MRASLIAVLLFVGSILGAQSNGHLMSMYVNDFRAERGLEPVAYSYSLETAAAMYVYSMLRLDVFEHDTVPWSVIKHRIEEKAMEQRGREVWLLERASWYADIIFQHREVQELQSAKSIIHAFADSPEHLYWLAHPDLRFIGIHQAIDDEPQRSVCVFMLAGVDNERDGAK